VGALNAETHERAGILFERTKLLNAEEWLLRLVPRPD
jgi:hypothetical protein